MILRPFPLRLLYGQKTNSRGYSSIRVDLLFAGTEMKAPDQALQPTAQTASFSWMSSVASIHHGGSSTWFPLPCHVVVAKTGTWLSLCLVRRR
jgi:hypothetical protein